MQYFTLGQSKPEHYWILFNRCIWAYCKTDVFTKPFGITINGYLLKSHFLFSVILNEIVMCVKNLPCLLFKPNKWAHIRKQSYFHNIVLPWKSHNIHTLFNFRYSSWEMPLKNSQSLIVILNWFSHLILLAYNSLFVFDWYWLLTEGKSTFHTKILLIISGLQRSQH